MKRHRPVRRSRHLLDSLESRVLLTVAPSPALAGDTNNDGTVNQADISSISQAWQQSAAGPADVNGDGFVDIVDFTAAVQNLQKTIYDGRSTVSGGVVNIWAPQAEDAGDSKWVAQPGELYGSSGKPVITDIQGSGAEDSYLLAALGSVASAQPTKLSNLITYDGTGWAVTFDGSLTGQPDAVVHVSRDFAADFQTRVPGTGVWWQVVEKAYAYYRTFNGTTSENTFESLEGGSVTDVWKTLGELYATVDASILPVQTAIIAIRTALLAGQPVVFETYSSSPWLTPDHSYVIVSVAGENMTSNVVTFDPDGFYDFWTLSQLLLSGSKFSIGLL